MKFKKYQLVILSDKDWPKYKGVIGQIIEVYEPLPNMYEYQIRFPTKDGPFKMWFQEPSILPIPVVNDVLKALVQ